MYSKKLCLYFNLINNWSYIFILHFPKIKLSTAKTFNLSEIDFNWIEKIISTAPQYPHALNKNTNYEALGYGAWI